MTRASMDDPSQLKLLLAMLQHEVRTPLSAQIVTTNALSASRSTRQ